MSENTAAANDDLVETVNAFSVLFIFLIAQLEEAKALPRGKMAQMLEIFTSADFLAQNPVVLGEHPAGENRLTLQIIRHVKDGITSPTEPPKRWQPKVIPGGKEDGPI